MAEIERSICPGLLLLLFLRPTPLSRARKEGLLLALFSFPTTSGTFLRNGREWMVTFGSASDYIRIPPLPPFPPTSEAVIGFCTQGPKKVLFYFMCVSVPILTLPFHLASAQTAENLDPQK